MVMRVLELDIVELVMEVIQLVIGVPVFVVPRRGALVGQRYLEGLRYRLTALCHYTYVQNSLELISRLYFLSRYVSLYVTRKSLKSILVFNTVKFSDCGQ